MKTIYLTGYASSWNCHPGNDARQVACPGKKCCYVKEFGKMTLNYAGRSHDEAVAARHKQKQKAQEQAGGEMAIEGTESDATHSCGELSERGKQVWRSGSGINGGGRE